MRIIKNADLKTTTWSGGTTTQLFLFPEGSSYEKRDFLFRISTATVEQEESVFTSLPGFKRKLMVLEGELLIKHKGHYEKKLKPFDQDEFDGGWETGAQGRVTDFNLMIAKGISGDLEAIVLNAGEEKKVGRKLVFGYVFRGSIKINESVVEAGDFISFDAEVLLHAIQPSQLVVITLRHTSSEQ